MHRPGWSRSRAGALLVSVVIAAVAVVAAFLPSTASSASRCTAYGNQHVAKVSRSISVSRDTWESHFTYRACWRPGDRTRLLGREYVDARGLPTSLVIGYAANGPWLVWGHRPAPGHDGRYRMTSVNLATGRRGPTVSQPADDVSRDDSGPIPIDDDAFRLYVVVTSHGNYVWLATNVASDSGRRIDALYTTDGHGHARRIDQGSLGSIRGLRARGDRVTWTNGGRYRRADLGRPQPAT